jgi:hypothetical protein
MTDSSRVIPDGVVRVLRDGAPALFLSPHLDDAVLSCAALMRTIATRTSVTVVTAPAHPGRPQLPPPVRIRF